MEKGDDDGERKRGTVKGTMDKGGDGQRKGGRQRERWTVDKGMMERGKGDGKGNDGQGGDGQRKGER